MALGEIFADEGRVTPKKEEPGQKSPEAWRTRPPR